MAQLNGLPVYEIKFDESLESRSGIDFISLVDYPAIESNFIALSTQKVHFSANKEKQLLYGAILIPDKPIYRNDPNGIGEYYVVFKEDTIERLVRKFQATQKTININYQHLENSQVESAVIQEIWLSGENDKSKDLGFDNPKGTAYVGAYIGNEKFWKDEVKTENVKGFSIEGFLDLEMSKLKKHIMSNQKFAEHKLSDNQGAVFVDGEIAVDNYVFSNYPSVTLVNGVKQVTQYPCWQETLVLEDGTILTLKDSKILKIETKQGMSNQKFVTAKTEAGVEIKTDAETMAVGVEVYTQDGDVKTPVANGTYVLDNGMTIEVVDGKIASMEETMTEEEVAVIQRAMSEVVAELKAEIADLKTQLAAIPAASSATQTPEPVKPINIQMSAKKKVYARLSEIREKNKNLN
nr:XkdF-like putative serine protease domain-containing protein [uncultured Flavobacterium sp.]